MKITYGIAAAVEGTLGELMLMPEAQRFPSDAPTLDELLSTLEKLTFIAETLAHLQAQEQLIPLTDKARKQIAALQPKTL